jgi:hypothetical protein
MAVNLKKYSIVCYPESCNIEEGLLYFKDVLESYAYILHDRDYDDEGNLKKPHYHLYMEFSKPINSNTICNHFNVKIWESVKNTDGVIQYMTHKRYTNKTQYESKEIKSFNIDVETICEKMQSCANNEQETLILILMYIKTNECDFCDLLEFILNNGYYYTYRNNYSIIKDYMNDYRKRRGYYKKEV